MRRRDFLVVVVATGTAGCPTPSRDRGDPVDPPRSTRLTRPTSPTGTQRFRRSLESAGVDVVYLAAVDRMVVLEYRTRASTSKELSSEIGWVAGLFADAIDAGWRATGLDATILDPNGWPLAAFRVEREWAVAYSDGDITTEEFSARVASTRELLD